MTTIQLTGQDRSQVQEALRHGQMEKLRGEITELQARIASMGLDGDCAYERAMSRCYAGLLEQHCRRLDRLSRGLPEDPGQG